MTERKLYFKLDGQSPVAESLRVLRTNIHFIDEKEKKTVVVTSAIPKEGKSFIAANYAMSEAMVGKKVLLLDCDLRRPRAHSTFGVEGRHGLSEVLMGERNVEELIVKEVEKNLDLLPTKPMEQNVTELLQSKKMESLVEEVQEKYDLVVIDTAPLMVATDAAILSKISDGVIFVNGYDMVSKKELLYAKEILSSAGANIYGMVVNKIDNSGYGYGYKSHGYYNNNYRYYQDYIKEDK
ncbi:CpsD/CapB family tyrosine-protein kinase [Ilyobacter polytropus]|uniref:non-specific protein-tyrosine kinase n=1 Tax=Ilyobacter polytropus (strain ATCC 51220 / DSM 2926 / LMG 16218 / CuHBu1) TaxID=572544 RepID=E3HB18_ILYPC|nr:CpsD/CapB family tyrosine-protein kinase [Ilyobacter polytropus]ADO82167.1 capsular exopolysaccharide family [Ilyobacter polytropus DSM 2926]